MFLEESMANDSTCQHITQFAGDVLWTAAAVKPLGIAQKPGFLPQSNVV